MAEQEGDHRRSLETAMANSDIASAAAIPREVRLGQILAFLVTIGFLGCGTYLIDHDRQIAGTILSGTGFVGIVTAFLARRKEK